MIVNPMVQGSGSNVTYHVENDQYNTFWPTEARPGQYVVTVSGGYAGTPTGYDETGTYAIVDPIFGGLSTDELPPKVKEIVENAPVTRAPPPSLPGYLFFVMPEENVKIVTTN